MGEVESDIRIWSADGGARAPFLGGKTKNEGGRLDYRKASSR